LKKLAQPPVFKFLGQFILLCITLVFFIKSWQLGYYISFGLLFLAIIGQGLVWILNQKKTYEKLTQFLKALEENDFTQSIPTFQNEYFNDFYKSLSRISGKLKATVLENESQNAFLQAVIQHLNIGLVGIDEQGNRQFSNPFFHKLLRINQFKNIVEISNQYSFLKEITPYSKQKIRICVENEWKEIATAVSEVKLLGKTYQIISVQDIGNELSEKEMEAWQNLTRILTHEIINSITPIASLAATLHENIQESENQLDTEIWQEVEQVIGVIEKRSQGLIRFVTDFRSFTKIPTPKPAFFKIEQLFLCVEMLLRESLQKNYIQLEKNIQPIDLQLFADLQLLEQVVLNLVKNAIEAFLPEHTERKIVLLAYTDENGKILVSVTDNGSGISEDALQNIFIPFFTTKKNGSGIGLPFSRQIMLRHNGSLTAQSELGKGSTFLLRF
jgi:two-component system, NtrC family, nitrogen regulation sensor histidine kinase NtrY